MSSKMPKITLKVTGPDGLTKDVKLGQDNAIVGSGPSATIQLIDPKVSAVHFLLKVEKSGQLTVLDLGSEAGTRLKGELIKEPMVLATGDSIHVGGSIIKIVIGDGDGTDVMSVVPRESTEEDDVVDASADVISDSQVLDEPREDTVRARAIDKKPEATVRMTPPPKPAEKTAPDRGSIADLLAKTSPTKPGPERAMTSTQFSPEAFALGPNGNKLLNEEFTGDEEPLDNNRVLEVALLWGDTVIDVRSFDPGQVVKIGPEHTNDFRVYDEEVKNGFELYAGNKVKVPVGAKLAVYREGEQKAGSGEVVLSVKERALVSLGTTHFIVRWIRPVKQSKTGAFDSMDFYFTKVLSVAFMAHLVLLIGFWITPLNNDLLSEDLFKNPSALVKTLIKAPEKKKKFDLSGVKEGAKAKDKEGKFGKKEAKKPEAAPSKKGAPIVDAKKREEDRKKIMNSGLLMGLHGPEGAVSNVFGPGGLGTGLNNALGGLQGGAGMGDAHGVGGLGSRGAGAGGGGTALGIGGLGTKGNGHGRGGYGNIDLGGRGKGDTRIVPGKTIVQGSLSKDVIAAIIRKHQNEIKYCYEVELNKHPDLYGKISVSFTIDGTGDVSEANVGETTMNNSNVENCMSTKIRRWKFPEPKGGGQVFVTYPWVFKASGSED